jgi:hypothetical protein
MPVGNIPEKTSFGNVACFGTKSGLIPLASATEAPPIVFGKDPQRAWRAPPGMKMFSGFARVPGRTHNGAAIA